MGLWHIRTRDRCIEYIDYGRCYSTAPSGQYDGKFWYNGYLVACPRHYVQTITDIPNFFYEPGEDRIIAHIVLATTYWPGWDARRYEFSAEDGSWVNREKVLNRDPDTFTGLDGLYWTGAATMGSYNKIYACRNSETKIREVSWRTGNPVPGGWWVDPYTWYPKSIYRFAVVNRVDGVIGGVSGWVLDCWKDIGSVPVRFGQLRLPNVLDYLAYESRRYCWGITRDGVIVKMDYLIPRYEMISLVQNPTPGAKGYRITFDTKRKQVVVFRWLPDAQDGACQCRLEFYYPVPKPAVLTQPVPVTPLKAGERVVLVSHLVGDGGEGLTPYNLEAEMKPPVEGLLRTPVSGTELNGRASFVYQAPWETCTETIKVKVRFEEP